LRRNRQRIRKIPLKSLISEGFWSEWGDSNARSLEPKSSAIPTSLHPDIHFSAMIPRRAVKIKFFLSVVIYVVKGDFMPLSAIVESPANAGVARLCGVSFCHAPDTATALPKQARYQLRYTPIYLIFYFVNPVNFDITIRCASLKNIVALLAWSASHCSLFFHLRASPESSAGRGEPLRPTALHPVIFDFFT
jgi:hypothetical protein